jgi:hypothetical protein
VKTDQEFAQAWAAGHAAVEATAAVLRDLGCQVNVTPGRLRRDRADIAAWEHDVDMHVNGEPYQHKHSDRYAWGDFPMIIVDERVKADRTPVTGYIWAFACGTRMVTPYDPATWEVRLIHDRYDRSDKENYLVPQERWWPLATWFGP